MKSEESLVDAVVSFLEGSGFVVQTEVPNAYRSADVAAIGQTGAIWVVECKVTNISKAIEQSKTHKLAADMVFVATPHRQTRGSTLEKLARAGVGLMYVMPDDTVEIAMEPSNGHIPWDLARERLRYAVAELGR